MGFVVPVLAAIGSAMGAGAASAAVVGGMAVASTAVAAGSAYSQYKGQQKMSDAMKANAPLPPTPPPQAAKGPDRTAMLAANAMAGGRSGGNRSTYLTGAEGVVGGLQLGKNSLLGQ